MRLLAAKHARHVPLGSIRTNTVPLRARRAKQARTAPRARPHLLHVMAAFTPALPTFLLAPSALRLRRATLHQRGVQCRRRAVQIHTTQAPDSPATLRASRARSTQSPLVLEVRAASLTACAISTFTMRNPRPTWSTAPSAPLEPAAILSALFSPH